VASRRGALLLGCGFLGLLLLVALRLPEFVTGRHVVVRPDIVLALPWDLAVTDGVRPIRHAAEGRDTLLLGILENRSGRDALPREAWLGRGVACDCRGDDCRVPQPDGSRNCNAWDHAGPVVRCAGTRDPAVCTLSVPITRERVLWSEASLASADDWGERAGAVVAFVDGFRLEGWLGRYAIARGALLGAFERDVSPLLLFLLLLVLSPVVLFVFFPPMGLALAALIPAVRLARRRREGADPAPVDQARDPR
jgi:hypothetical protein